MIIRDEVARDVTDAQWTGLVAQQTLEQLDIAVLQHILTHTEPSCDSDTPARNCPPPEIYAFQKQTWRDGATGLEIAQHIAALNPDALMIIGNVGDALAWSVAQMLVGFQVIDWTPKSISWAGALEDSVGQFSTHGRADLMYT